MKTIEFLTTLKINHTPTNGSLNRTKTSPVITEIFVISVYPLCKGAPHTRNVKKTQKKTKNKTPAAPIVPVCISRRCHLTNFEQATGKCTGETRGITITPATTLKKISFYIPLRRM